MKKIYNIFSTLIKTFIFLFVIVALIITLSGEICLVSGESMETAFQDNDILYANRLEYRIKDPERFDVVYLSHKDEETGESECLIKRIIGLPGETVDIRDGKVYINNKLLESDVYGKEVIEEYGDVNFPLALKTDEYFVLGDNRNISLDSRYKEVGCIKKEQIKGKIWVKMWPAQKVYIKL